MSKAIRQLWGYFDRARKRALNYSGAWKGKTDRNFNELQLRAAERILSEVPDASMRTISGRHDQHWLEFDAVGRGLLVRVYGEAADVETAQGWVNHECWDFDSPDAFLDEIVREVTKRVAT